MSTPTNTPRPEDSFQVARPRKTGAGGFNVLAVLRSIRDDGDLSPVQFSTLVAAALRTNRHGRVRGSLELLAQDAKISTKSVSRALREEPVTKYFTVTRTKRYVNLDWREVDTESDSGGHSVRLEEGAEVDSLSAEVDSQGLRGGLSVRRDGHGVPPSTTSSTYPSTSSSRPDQEGLEKKRLKITRKKTDTTTTHPPLGEATTSREAARSCFQGPVGTLEGSTVIPPKRVEHWDLRNPQLELLLGVAPALPGALQEQPTTEQIKLLRTRSDLFHPLWDSLPSELQEKIKEEKTKVDE